jgi:integrase
MLREMVTSVLEDADVSTRKISHQLGHAKISMTQDGHLCRRLTDRQTAEVLEGPVTSKLGGPQGIEP